MATAFDGLSAAAKSLWAKSGDDSGWLTLPQHMRDSADVAALLWDEWASPQVRAACSSALGLEPPAARALFRWLACVHDIGKASRHFAGQLDQRGEQFSVFSSRIRDAGLPMRMPAIEAQEKIWHPTAGRAITIRWLTEKQNMTRFSAVSLASVIDAHHGLPSFTTEFRHADACITGEYEEPWREVWDELLAAALEYCEAATPLSKLADDRFWQLPVTGQMLLTGLVIMTDWIASNSDAFPMSPAGDQLRRAIDGYTAIDLPNAWHPAPIDDITKLMRQRFSWPDSASPRPVQIAASELAGTAPMLMIIEAPTGEGKTEAALVATERLAPLSGAGGVFFGAPTMSTSDALFRRIESWAQHATPTGEVNSLFLGHSKASLNPDYQRLRFDGIGLDCGHDDYGDVVATQWLSGRKTGMLANMVVGTVDQLLIMSLQSRHAMLRHLALAGKVVVIDEVHAYDTYMSGYLHESLRWLAAYGASVILLSATLPVTSKRKLLEAYQGGLPLQPDGREIEFPGQLSTAYPLITTLDSANGLTETEVASRPPDAHVAVEILEDTVDALVDCLSAETREGGCVLVLCNSVVRAQQVLNALPADLLADAELLHARFIASDRASREQQLVAKLGPDARRGQGRPSRGIVIATQVAEQSLDIDVDLLITDIAPVDLLIQRMGRLHRHTRPETDRPERLRQPRMLIRGVLENSPTAVRFDQHSELIYEPKTLIASLHELNTHAIPHGITRPNDVAGFVQRAYGDEQSLPAGWQQRWQEACATWESNQQRAEQRSKTFRFPAPYDATSILGLFDAQRTDVSKNAAAEEQGFAQVRDSEPSLEVVLVVGDADGYSPLPWVVDDVGAIPNDAEVDRVTAHALARSTVRLPRRFGTYHFEQALTELESSTPAAWQRDPLLRGLLALRLDSNLCGSLCGIELQYSRELGLSEVSK